MNRREIYILLGVCAVLLLPIGFYLRSTVNTMFATRRASIATLKADVKRFQDYNRAGEVAKRKVREYEARSLPADPIVARREYQNWLLMQIEKTGLTEPKVDFKSVTNSGDLYVAQEFTVHAKGGLPQAVEFLHGFYSQDWLHRITRLTVRPVKDTKLVDLSLTVDTLSLKKAKDTPQLVERPAKRLELANSKAYYDSIVGRNLFGPANNPPKVSVSGIKDVYLGRSADLTVRGSDADVLDKFTYRLVQAADPSAKLDPASGKFSWRPSSTGKFEFTVEAIDDGYPTRPSKPEKFVVNVTEQPPRVERPVVIDEGFKGFDHSKFTVFTGVLDIEGQGEVWLHNRPGGEMLKLHPGDKFRIGSVQGTIAEIGEYDFTFDRDGKRLKVAHGENLFNAKVIGDTPQPAEAALPTEKPPTVETSTTAPGEAKPAAPAPPTGEVEKPAVEAKNAPAEAPPEAAKAG